jgi:ATP-dependent protease ClpP protease subunit
MYNIIRFLLIYVMHLSAFSATIIADNNDSRCISNISIAGLINSGDAIVFQKKIDKLKTDFEKGECRKILKDFKFYGHLDLHSKGGNLNEALKIGQIVRENELQVTVAFNKECFSSCVFILAAGVSRTPWGKIGIHRPYFDQLKGGTSIAEIKAIREENIRIMKSYLKKMDISESIMDDMLSIEPDKIKILSEDDLTRYRLNLMDADYEEKMVAEEAQSYNLTSSMFRQRRALSESKCGYVGIAIDKNRYAEFRKCQDMTMLNISESEYLNRESKVNTICRKIDKESRGTCIYDARILGK